ncbi:MAG: hypothetical protein M1269_12725 [Chloroflexi bacterium]|nr:hypothetical protein [Chloroflexota bacterium]
MEKSVKILIIIAAAVFIFSALNLIPYMNRYHQGINDEGMLTYGGQRVLDGQFPYRDFFSHLPPFNHLLTSAWFSIFGSNIFSARLLMILIGGLMGLLIFLISLRILPLKIAWAPPVLFSIAGAAHWPVLSHHWNGVVFLLLSLWLILIFEEKNDGGCGDSGRGGKGGKFILILAGISCGTAFLFMQSEGIAAIAGLLIFLIARGRSRCACYILPLVIGFLAPLLVTFIALNVNGALPSYIYQNYIWVKETAISFNASSFSLNHVTKIINSFALQAGGIKHLTMPVIAWLVNASMFIFVIILKYALFYPVLIGVLILLLLKKERGGPEVSLWALIAVLVPWILITAYKQDMLYLNYLTPLWYIALCYGMYNIFKSARGGVIAITVIAGLFLVHNYFLINESKDFKFPIAFPRGTLYSSSREKAGGMNKILVHLEKNTKQGDKIFAYPYASSFYFLTGRKNSTMFDALWPLLSPRSLILKAKEEIEASRTPYIYFFILSPDALDAYPTVDRKLFHEEGIWMNGVILDGYLPDGDFIFCRVFKRNK